MRVLPVVNANVDRGSLKVTGKNEGVLPPQSVPVGDKVYQFQVLPFRLNTAPQVFTRLAHTVAAYLHHQGISVIPYLDDWLIQCYFTTSLSLLNMNMVGLRLN